MLSYFPSQNPKDHRVTEVSLGMVLELASTRVPGVFSVFIICRKKIECDYCTV